MQNETPPTELQQRTPPKPGRGTTILVLGILSIVLTVMFCAVLGPALGIPAWVMGKRDEEEILKGIIDRSELSITKAGKICGIVGTFFGMGILILAIIIPILLLIILFIVGGSILSCCG